MKPLLYLTCLTALLCATVAFALQDAPDMPAMGEMSAAEPTAEHEWLQQLVGEWDVVTEASMVPGEPPMQIRSTEKVRSLGGLWTIAESTATFGGEEMTSVVTLGYDPAAKAFVGSWVDTMQPFFWNYTGSLDASRKVLSLLAEGPSFEDPSKMAMYRDAIEIVDADHKVLTSALQGEDGTWNEFMRAQYTRKK